MTTMTTKAKTKCPKPKAKRASHLPASHIVTGRDASGRIVATEKGDRRLCERTATEWRGSGLQVEIQPINQ